MTHQCLIILNDPPYGSERSYNALRLAATLSARDGEHVRVFLMGDAAVGAQRGQRVPTGYYNVGTMLKAVLTRGGQVAVCGTCMDARGMTETALVDGCRRSSMDELTDWTQAADQVLVF
ncbi:MAG TPA: DsrE family protein [Gemmatimonadales bacterium]